MITIRKKVKKKKQKNQTKYGIILLISIAIATIVLILSKGKYTFNHNTLHAQNSEKFYFESDFLNLGEGTEYIYTDWDTSQEYYSIKFHVQNYMDELRYNNLPISYQINLSNKSEGMNTQIYINGSETREGILQGNAKNSDEVEVRIRNSNVSNMSLKIEAISTSPYTKTLEAFFIIEPKVDEKPYEYNLVHDECADYDKVLIQTNEYSGKLKIAYNSQKTTPDIGNYILQGVEKVQIADGNYYYVEIEVQNHKNYQIDFIKKNRSTAVIVGSTIENGDIIIGY